MLITENDAKEKTIMGSKTNKTNQKSTTLESPLLQNHFVISTNQTWKTSMDKGNQNCSYEDSSEIVQIPLHWCLKCILNILPLGQK